MSDAPNRPVSTPRRPRFDFSRWSDRTAAIAIAIAALLALLILSPFSHGPGDPAAVSGDARLGRCGGNIADVEFAFAIPRASEYQRYLPAMERTSELESSKAALVVIYRSAFSFSSATPDPTTPRDIRDLCIYVGLAGQGSLNYFSGVSIAGLRATSEGPMLVPPAQT